MEYPKKPLQKPYFWDTKNHACIIFILLYNQTKGTHWEENKKA